VSTIRKYIKENVFCRCGQAVSRLAASDLIPRPEMSTSEAEVHEWWLVSPDLAAKLRAGRLPVLQFGELHMWGREATGVALEDDEGLIAAIGPVAAPSAGPRRKLGKRAAARKRRSAQ
jgi:hypothetical protein